MSTPAGFTLGELAVTPARRSRPIPAGGSTVWRSLDLGVPESRSSFLITPRYAGRPETSRAGALSRVGESVSGLPGRSCARAPHQQH